MHYPAAMRRIRYALRSLSRQPGFTLLAVLALTVGIGANTAVFSVVHAVVLKSLPYLQPDELVFITEAVRGTTNGTNVPPANYIEYKDAKSFTAMGAAEAWGATLTGFDAPEQVRGLRVTASTFDVLAVKPAIGHTQEHLPPIAECRRGAPRPVALVAFTPAILARHGPSGRRKSSR